MFSDIQAIWQSQDDNCIHILKQDTSEATTKVPAKYDYVMTYNNEVWQRTTINPAGKKYPEVRLNPAICFLNDSLLLHGGITIDNIK